MKNYLISIIKWVSLSYPSIAKVTLFFSIFIILVNSIPDIENSVSNIYKHTQSTHTFLNLIIFLSLSKTHAHKHTHTYTYTHSFSHSLKHIHTNTHTYTHTQYALNLYFRRFKLYFTISCFNATSLLISHDEKNQENFRKFCRCCW